MKCTNDRCQKTRSARLKIGPYFMKLDVVHRDPNQAIGIYGNVCLIVRWAQFSAADLAIHRRALTMLQERSPGPIAVLQVNRFIPGPKPGMDEAGQRATRELVRFHASAVRIYALVLSDLPFWISSIRSIYTRMAHYYGIRVNMRPFTDLQQAIHAVCAAMRDPGGPTLEPADLRAALDELEKQRPTKGEPADLLPKN